VLDRGWFYSKGQIIHPRLGIPSPHSIMMHPEKNQPRIVEKHNGHSKEKRN